MANNWFNLCFLKLLWFVMYFNLRKLLSSFQFCSLVQISHSFMEMWYFTTWGWQTPVLLMWICCLFHRFARIVQQRICFFSLFYCFGLHVIFFSRSGKRYLHQNANRFFGVFFYCVLFYFCFARNIYAFSLLFFTTRRHSRRRRN